MSDTDIARRARVLAETFDRSFAAPVRVREDEGRPALVIRVGGDPYLLLLEGLSGIAKRKRVVPLPGGAPAQLGLSGLRGGLVGVFSMPVLLEGQVVVSPSNVAAVPADARRHVAGLVRLDGEASDRALLDLGAMLARLGSSSDTVGA